ncbi:hypothetical protein BGW38_001963, partial [Lunasporangiospora selenospora]
AVVGTGVFVILGKCLMALRIEFVLSLTPPPHLCIPVLYDTLARTGNAAALQAGPSVTVSFLLGGIVSGIAALSYAEMASMIPIAGSAYTYAYATIGELAAWIIGWNLILEYMIGAATVTVGWSSYFVAFMQDAFKTQLSVEWTNAPIFWENETFRMTGDYFNAPAFVITMIVTATNFFGIQMTAMINNALVAFKILVLVIMIFSLIPFIKPENYVPYIPPNTGTFGEFGPSGLLQAASSVFFAYIGFDSVSTTAQEAKEPQVNLPFGIMMTLIISATIYISLSAVTVGVANYKDLGGGSPLVDTVRLTNMNWLVVLTELGALAATTSVILVLLIAQARVFYAMANDGLIPRFFGRVHKKYKTPYVSTMISGIVCAICGGLLPIRVLSDISSVGTIFAFFVVNIAVIILRYTRKTVPRRFKVPGGPWLLPGIGAASSLLLLQGAKRETIVRLLVWMAVGVVVYLFYGRTHSEVNNPRMVQDSEVVVVNGQVMMDRSDDPYRDEHGPIGVPIQMQVLHEHQYQGGYSNSVDSEGSRGAVGGNIDEDLQRQYERQLARRQGRHPDSHRSGQGDDENDDADASPIHGYFGPRFTYGRNQCYRGNEQDQRPIAEGRECSEHSLEDNSTNRRELNDHPDNSTLTDGATRQDSRNSNSRSGRREAEVNVSESRMEHSDSKKRGLASTRPTRQSPSQDRDATSMTCSPPLSACAPSSRSPGSTSPLTSVDPRIS